MRERERGRRPCRLAQPFAAKKEGLSACGRREAASDEGVRVVSMPGVECGMNRRCGRSPAEAAGSGANALCLNGLRGASTGDWGSFLAPISVKESMWIDVSLRQVVMVALMR